jgi:uncharacterized protein (TIGR02284 family)
MAETSHDIRTLNSLIATIIDSVDGYCESAKDVDSPRFSELFLARADERRDVCTQLRTEVSRLGGEPEDDGTILAARHRAFVNLKSIVATKDDQAVVAEVERGEDHLKAKFEDALKDDALSPTTREIVQAVWPSVQQGHDEMSQLKHTLEASA